MADELTLPQLPAVSWDERTQSISTRARKRARSNAAGAPPMFATSSDPAFFSSDDDPAIENYTPARRKKRLVGSWYEQQPLPSSDSCFGDDVIPQPKPNRKFVRNIDSGVWMAEAGDDTPFDDDAKSQAGPAYSPNPMPQLGRRRVPKLSEAEVTMRKVIQACLDEGQETIDISGLNLKSISSDTIAMLSTLTPIPIVAEGVPFEQRDANIKLFIANNGLETVPGTLFSLKNLTSLSLRGNRLEELPDSIGNLTNLRELNVAQNRLKHLPSSMLKLIGPGSKMTFLRISLNEFLEFDPSLVPEPSKSEVKFSSTSGISAYFKTRSPVRFLHSAQESLRFDAVPSPDAKSAKRGGDTASQTDLDGLSSPSRVPSLMELALRKCYQSSRLHQFPDLIDGWSDHLRGLFERLVAQQEAGGVHCSTCDTLVATPAIQWIEWWGVKDTSSAAPISLREHDRDVVPFLFVGCTTACGPRDIQPGTTLEDLAEAERSRIGS
ncbi:uncharacterized protein DNG_02694 [Cephalotrichum gorgonifer]|uniref:Uncharacterized protein n=1 Tax=Cephalotrichum gorgonifer TaxID=2041049 RepID=A0AAE8MU00_9PEZI|nr:uncharacterized protein DNG_02694 [Cephalotrichum gorgonifer]